MNLEKNQTQKIKELIEYYKEKKLALIGFNDSQGVNSNIFLKKGLLECIASALTTNELNPIVIDAFSLLMNKTEHIDYFLEGNLSVEEIKLSQVYSCVDALKKVMSNIHLPKVLGNFGYISQSIYPIVKGDNKTFLTRTLVQSREPIIIYSSGVSNLKREIGYKQFSIKKDYHNRNQKPNFYYTLKKATDPKVLNHIIDGINHNFEILLSINTHTDIYVLGASVPQEYKIEEMNIFRELVLSYNEKLQHLCNNYQFAYINTETIDKENFHSLANYILDCMYERKIENPMNSKIMAENFDFPDYGPNGVAINIEADYKNCLEKSKILSKYERKRELEKAKEHYIEEAIFKKVMRKSKSR